MEFSYYYEFGAAAINGNNIFAGGETAFSAFLNNLL
jgi:hypothetical protein